MIKKLLINSLYRSHTEKSFSLGTYESCKLFIDGSFVDSSSSSSSSLENNIYNPGNGKCLGPIRWASRQDVEKTIEIASKRAQTNWSTIPSTERAKWCFKISDWLSVNRDSLAIIESLNTGKPITDSTFEIEDAASTFSYFGSIAQTQSIGTIHSPMSNPSLAQELTFSTRSPIGVVGAIVPWNYPMMMTAWKIAPAIAAGNSIILKPSEATPLSTLALCEGLQEIGFPKGIINVLPGSGPEVGSTLVSSPIVGKVSFTGSTETGRKILAGAAASNLKTTTLELGGKGTFIVFEDADLDAAANSLTMAAFSNSGQNCCQASRALIARSVYPQFMEKLISRVKALKPFSLSNFMTYDLTTQASELNNWNTYGPMITYQQYEKVLDIIENTREDNVLELGGRIEAQAQAQGGWFVPPTIFSNVDDISEREEFSEQHDELDRPALLSQDEIFGPVLSILKPFDDEEEAISRANDTDYGLAMGAFTTSTQRSLRLASKLEAGNIWINGYNATAPWVPFGGLKQSGQGKDLGLESYLSNTKQKSIQIL